MQTKHIVIVYTKSGGGHKATALALQSALEREGRYRVSLIDAYDEVLRDLDLIQKTTSYTGEDVYNQFVLGKGWTGLFCVTFYAVVMLNIRLFRKAGRERFAEYWRENRPDLVISVMPLLNTTLSQSLQERRIPFMVILTDYREPKKYAWFPRSQDYTIVCGTDEAYRDVIKKPHPESKVFKTSGQIVDPSFYIHKSKSLDVDEERDRLGLDAARRTGCILYGGGASWRMVELAEGLIDLRSDLQMIFLCGHNDKVAQAIGDLDLPYPHIIQGYTREIPYYMRLADCFVGKPGPGSLSEALVMGLPLVLDVKNMMVQERFNVKWVKRQGVGMTFRTIRGFQRCISRLWDAETAETLADRTRRLNNQAVLEVPAIVDQALDNHG